jgi:hypothetical protein
VVRNGDAAAEQLRALKQQHPASAAPAAEEGRGDGARRNSGREPVSLPQGTGEEEGVSGEGAPGAAPADVPPRDDANYLAGS